MKKSCLSLLFFFLFSFSFAETIKLKDGAFITGSIISQTEYTLNLNTSYGPVVLNQREVEAILPDQHRIFLKGGSQLVGIIIDLDEFNLKLQTTEGTVNIDMPQILSIEVYDYEQGENLQKTISKKQSQQALSVQKESSAVSYSEEKTPNTVNTGGLNFDSDIEKVFDVKKAEVVNGQVQTIQEISAADIRAQRNAQLSEEEAFLRGDAATTQEEIKKTAEAARSGKLEKIKKAEAKKARRPKDANFDKYFAISIGAQLGDLQLDNTEKAGFENTDGYEVGGTGVRAEAAFLWRVKDSNLWLGPALAIVNIPNTSFEDLDPSIAAANQDAADRGLPIPYPTTSDRLVTTGGQMIDLMLKGNYYFNPDSLFSFYMTATAGYRMLSLNYRGVIQSDSLKSNSFVAAAGLGTEVHVDDLMLALELQEFFVTYSGKFSGSSSANTVISAKFSWKF